MSSYTDGGLTESEKETRDASGYCEGDKGKLKMSRLLTEEEIKVSRGKRNYLSIWDWARDLSQTQDAKTLNYIEAIGKDDLGNIRISANVWGGLKNEK